METEVIDNCYKASFLRCKTATAFIVFLTCFITACSHTPVVEEIDNWDLRQVLYGRALLGDEADDVVLPEDDVLGITPGMKRFAERYVPKKGRDMKKVESLQRALMIGMRYDPHKTYTPKETFELGESNCLGFTLLFYTLAKHVGLKAYINEVDVPPTWNLTDDATFVFMRHVNVKIKLRDGRSAIVDLDIQSYDPQYKQRNVELEDAHAQFYNNRGVEFMMLGDKFNAFRYMRKAIEINPKLGHTWNNLGALYSRNGHYTEAEIAYLKALTLMPKSLSTLSNLSSLYYRSGDIEQAKQYEEKVLYHRQKNPYYHYSIAKKAFEKFEFENALASLNKAFSYEKKDKRFYELGADIYRKLNRPDKAENMLAKGEKQIYRR